MNKFLKCFVVISLSLLIFTGCQQTIDFSYTYLDINQVTNSATQKWIKDIGNKQGIYIAKAIKNEKEVYYIFVNNEKTSGFSIKSDPTDGLVITVHKDDQALNKRELNQVNITNKNPKQIKQITLNDKKIDTATIKELK